MSSSSSATHSATPPAPPIQQPLAATLAPEILTMIFKEAEKLSSSLNDKRKHRLRQGLVCRSWFFAQLERNEFAVVGINDASALLKSVVLNPEQPKRAHKLTIEDASDLTSPLLSLCISLVELTIVDGGSLAADVLKILPASLRKLNLDLTGLGAVNSVPDLPNTINLGGTVSCTVSWNEVGSAKATLLPRITRLRLTGKATKKTLEKLVPQLSAIEHLNIEAIKGVAEELPSLIGDLGTLKSLTLAVKNSPSRDEITTELVHRIIAHAPPTLAFIKVGLPSNEDAAAWTEAKKVELKSAANDERIKLDFAPSHARRRILNSSAPVPIRRFIPLRPLPPILPPRLTRPARNAAVPVITLSSDSDDSS